MDRTASRRLTVGMAAIALVIAACGGSEEATPASTSVAPESTPVSATTSATAGTPSAGCEAASPTPGESTVTVSSGGVERNYIRYVPEGLEDGEAAPLVLDFPAYSPAAMETEFSGFTKPDAVGKVLADEVGAVVVTPEPTNGGGALLTWNYVGTEGWTDDTQFVADLLDDVEASVCIDADRVLATGFAVGGVFASIVTCELPDRVAVLATVSGLYDPEGCAANLAKPVIAFHGTGDRFIPFDGAIGSGPSNLGLSPETSAGLAFMLERPGALDSSTAWADRGGCEGEPVEESTAEQVGSGVSLKVWPECDEGVDVELYEIDGGEHTWPGSIGMGAYEGLLGPVSDEIDASEAIWDFFEAHT